VTIPDALETLDPDDVDELDEADVVESTHQEWALSEIEAEEIEVTFD
jgi:hypothetical protein